MIGALQIRSETGLHELAHRTADSPEMRMSIVSKRFEISFDPLLFARLKLSFDALDFLNDIAELIDYGPQRLGNILRR